jgi:hypothetical protein
MRDASDAIRTYIRAKDGNRPHLLGRAFALDVNLEVVNKTDAISFPSSVTGLDAVTDALVRRFSREFENVYTFCLSSPAKPESHQFSCDWLVGMSSKGRGDIRVGCGRYDWFFQPGEQSLVERLKITIERMKILSPDHLNAIMGWLADLSYPWCPAQAATVSIPRLQELVEIRDYINRSR